MSDFYRLVYASKNLLQGSDAEIAQAVAQILEASQRNNVRVDVTGALMFNAGAFAQVLEGPQQGVESTFERIQCDPRHGDVTVLQCGPAERRSFANWSMAFVGQSNAGRERWEGIARTSGFDLSRLDGDAVFAMLHGLVLDEEGLSSSPAVVPTPPQTSKMPGPGLDVARVRAELPTPGLARQVVSITDSVPDSERAEARRPPADGGPAVADTALVVLRTALAQERQRTTDLRNELDEARIALARQEAQSGALRQERDLWAERARLLATVVSDDAAAILRNAPGRTAEAAATGPAGRTGAAIRAGQR